jgi:G:T/U-mismatch repair DNA glycosylase
VTVWVRPATLAALLDGAAGILAACGIGLAAAALLRARRRPQAERRADELARALQLARDARTRPERDRRTAAGYVARLLGRRHGDLARTAGDLAWSRPTPTPDSLTELVEQVEQERPA